MAVGGGLEWSVERGEGVSELLAEGKIGGEEGRALSRAPSGCERVCVSDPPRPRPPLLRHAPRRARTTRWGSTWRGWRAVRRGRGLCVGKGGEGASERIARARREKKARTPSLPFLRTSPKPPPCMAGGGGGGSGPRVCVCARDEAGPEGGLTSRDTQSVFFFALPLGEEGREKRALRGVKATRPPPHCSPLLRSFSSGKPRRRSPARPSQPPQSPFPLPPIAHPITFPYQWGRRRGRVQPALPGRRTRQQHSPIGGSPSCACLWAAGPRRLFLTLGRPAPTPRVQGGRPCLRTMGLVYHPVLRTHPLLPSPFRSPPPPPCNRSQPPPPLSLHLPTRQPWPRPSPSAAPWKATPAG